MEMTTKLLIPLCIAFNTLQAQAINAKLGGTTSNETFDVTDSGDNLLFRVQGDGNVGIGTHTPNATIHILGNDGLLVQEKNFNDGWTTLYLGAGIRMHFYPKKAAFRVGYVDGTQWNDDHIGDASIAMGNNTTASGARSTAMGFNTLAIGDYSTAMGNRTEARGDYSTAMGSGTLANGDHSTAMGSNVTTGGFNGSFIIGDNSTSATHQSTGNNQMLMRFAGGYRLFTTNVTGPGAPEAQLAAGSNSWTSYSDSTKKENYQQANGEYFLNSIAKLKLGSWNYINQNSEIRHYGPMAQEIYHYFGSDKYGTVGNDTTLATADMDGIMMIAIQELAKRTADLLTENQKMKEENYLLKQRLEAVENKLN